MNNIASRVGLVFLVAGAALTLWYLVATPLHMPSAPVAYLGPISPVSVDRYAAEIDAAAIEADLGQVACAGGMGTVCLCCAAFLFAAGAIADAIGGKAKA